ncbi:hypothetical protein D3C76_1568880 [compost metagenome]
MPCMEHARPDFQIYAHTVITKVGRQTHGIAQHQFVLTNLNEYWRQASHIGKNW